MIAERDKIEPDFVEVKKSVAIQYFGGIADGLGFQACPEEPFETLDKIKAWRLKSVEIWVKTRY